MKTKVIIFLSLLILLFPCSLLAAVYNNNDYSKLQTFLNEPSAIDGKTNGQALNDLYDKDNPSTWTGVTWNADNPISVASIDWKNKNLAGDLNLNGFTSLTDCDISQNKIDSVSLTGTDNLVTFDAYSNILSQIDLSGKTKLQMLYLSCNNFTSLDLSGLSVLRYFECVENKLTQLDVSDCVALTHLYFYNNDLTTLDLSNNDNLFIISGGNNKLTDSLDISDKLNLQYCFVNDNKFTSLKTAGNAFNYLDTRNNNLSSIQTGIFSSGQTFTANGKGYIDFVFADNIGDPKAVYLYAFGHSNMVFNNWTINGAEVSKSPIYFINKDNPPTDNLVANFITGITSSPANGTIYKGGRIVITPSLTGGTWEYDHDYLSGDFSDPDKAVFTALKEGKTRIYYQPNYTYDVNENAPKNTYYSVQDNKVYADVTINKTILPQTGQNFTFAIMFALMGMLMAGAAIVIRLKKSN